MKIILIFLLLIFSLISRGQSNWNDSSFVHRDGKQIVNGQGDPIVLEGVNLGGWLLWEGWIWGGGLSQEKTIYNKIQSRLDTTQAQNFRDSVYRNFITRADLEKVAKQCFNAVRVPFNHILLEDDSNPYVYKPAGWVILDSLLAWCEDYNVYAILDLHAAPGGQSEMFDADPDSVNLWESPTDQKRTVLLWKAIAERYKNRGIVAGYDLLNEPIPPSDSALLNIYNEIIDSIRAVDTHHMLFIEGTEYASDFSLFSLLPDPDMAFEFHFYTWLINNIPAALEGATLLSEAMNVPVWCGEWGENTYTQLDSTMLVLRNQAYGISGNAFWTWKKVPNSYPYLNGMSTSYDWEKSIIWIGDSTSSEPTAAEMQQGIADFITNIKIRNCTLNDTLDSILNFCYHPAIILSKNNEAMRVIVFPNPNSGKFYMEISSGNPEKLKIKITNLPGISVYEADNVIINQKCRKTIDLTTLKNGVYFISIESEKEIVIKKILIEK